MSPLEPPRPVFPGPDGIVGSPQSLGTPPPPGSPHRNAHRSSIIIGLEPVGFDDPSGMGMPGDRTSRIASSARSSSAGSRPPNSNDSGMTFDDILGGGEEKKAKKKKGKFF
uniref:Choriogenin hminor n=1 Tax=Colletotrichum fructicola (strain Nara gc5) TaxID=1213859 RepID=L2GGU3_COLFN